MKPKTMILMIVAVTCGLGASYMTSRLLAHREAPEKVSILVAKKNLNMGDIVKLPDDMFVHKQVSRGDEPRMAIQEPDKLKGRQLKRSLRPGDFVTPEDLIDGDTSMGLPFLLPQGHQAVGIRVNMESVAGGFASLPHSRVNIISTRRGSDDKSTKATLLLEDVLVVAADAQMTNDQSGRAMPANVVTVALKSEDILKLELAKQLGLISLALRKFNDRSRSPIVYISAENLKNGTLPKEGSTDEDLMEAPPGVNLALPALPHEKPPAANGKNSPDHVLTIYSGDKAKQYFFYTPQPGGGANTTPAATATPRAPTILQDAAPPKKN
jgi:Flp pilus assembly protein CpaB